MLDSLAELTGLNYEAGRAYTYKNGAYTFSNHDGNANEPEIKYEPTNSSPIDGFIHTHYDGTLPIFSVSDLLIPYYWNESGGVVNIDSFALGLVTSQGTYFLFFDSKKYLPWAKNNISSIALLEFTYRDLYKINVNTDADTALESFVRFLNANKDCGIQLMKKQGKKHSYKKIYIHESDDSVVGGGC